MIRSIVIALALGASSLVGCSSSEEPTGSASAAVCPAGIYKVLHKRSYEPDDCFDGCNYGMMVDGQYSLNAAYCAPAPDCAATPPVERSAADKRMFCRWTLPCGEIQAFTDPQPVTGEPGPFKWYFSSRTCPVSTTW